MFSLCRRLTRLTTIYRWFRNLHHVGKGEGNGCEIHVQEITHARAHTHTHKRACAQVRAHTHTHTHTLLELETKTVEQLQFSFCSIPSNHLFPFPRTLRTQHKDSVFVLVDVAVFIVVLLFAVVLSPISVFLPRRAQF